MKISLVPSDNVAVVGGDARQISFAGIDPTIHAVQFDTVKSKGHVEFLEDIEPRLQNEEITDFAPYQIFVDRWTAAAPPPPPPPTQAELDRIARRATLATEAAADTFIDALRGATPDQIRTFVQNNVTDLPSAKLFIAKLAVAVAYALGGGSDK